MAKRKAEAADNPRAVVGANGIAADELRQLIERIERFEADKSEIASDVKEVYAEAKGRGFDTKTMRRIVRERKRNHAERAEAESIFDLYWHALGMPEYA